MLGSNAYLSHAHKLYLHNMSLTLEQNRYEKTRLQGEIEKEFILNKHVNEVEKILVIINV